MKPRLRLSDPEFVYTPSHATDIRKRFARVRRELALQQKQAVVTPIKQRSAK